MRIRSGILPGTAWALILVVLLGQVLAFADVGARSYVLGLSLLLLDLLGTIVSVRAARRSPHPLTWRLAAAGRALSLLSTIGFAVNAVHPEPGWQWAGIGCGLLMFLGLTLTALSVSAGRLTGVHRSGFIAEVATVLSSGFMLVWHFVIDPALTDRPGLNLIFDLGYPLGSLLLLTAVTAVLLRGSIALLPSSLVLLISGIMLYAVADTAFSAVRVQGEATPNSPTINAALVIAQLLMTVAAIKAGAEGRAGAPVGAGPHARMPAWSAHLPYVAVAIGNVLLIAVTIRGREFQHWGGLILGQTAMTAALAARQIISLRESRRLNVTDPLTGLANLPGLQDAVDRALQRRSRPALMLLDLDGFKQVNDRYGHDAGDRLLVEFARLLRGATRRDDVRARIGGDEFVVMLDDAADEDQLVAVADRILTTLAASPVLLGGDEVTIRASIGLAAGRDDDTAETLKRRADLAMYESKRSGSHGWRLYEKSMTDRRTRDALVADALLRALGTDQFSVVYQPLVDLGSHRPVAVEALLRWQHPVLGTMSPAEFIPIAERIEVIHQLGLDVLRQTCAQVQRWRTELPGLAELHGSVNVSAAQLREPTFLDDVFGVLEQTGLPAGALVLEITESSIVDEEIAIPALQRLREHGIDIAVDDFGTGYSSLHQLTQLPVDLLKIDRSFVAKLDGTTRGAAVAEAVIRLSQVLGLRTVAEGVETAAQAAELQLLGCPVAQGYLFARPMTPDAFAAFVREKTTTADS